MLTGGGLFEMHVLDLWCSSKVNVILSFVIQTAEACKPPSTHLHSHDQAAGHVPHLVHHAVSPPAELADLLQVVGLHLKVLRDETSTMNEAVTTDRQAERTLISFTATLQNTENRLQNRRKLFYIIQATKKNIIDFDFGPARADTQREPLPMENSTYLMSLK